MNNNSYQSKVILYIEDNPVNINLVKQIVENLTPYEFISTEDAVNGLALAEQKLPDLILMDINMPHMNGYEALLKLQNNNNIQHIPVIAISGNAMEEEINKAQSAGFKYYITKPLKVSDVIDIFDELLG